MVLVLVTAPMLSRITFGDDKHVLGIALMSLTLLFGGISAGQGALLQGLRRLRDLAASQIIGTLFGAVVSVVLVWWLRENGIVPYLLAISAFGILLTWWYSQKVTVVPVNVSWRESIMESRALLSMGLAFTVAALIGGGTSYLTRVLVQHQLGIAAVGIYTATWTLSTYYINIVLGAMGTDFMPRLTASSRDHQAMNRLVNEQTEMGVLIALPGVIATMTLAPWVMKVFYSAAFVEGADVARWQILGVFIRVVSWPMGYILIAKGKSILFTVSEFIFGIINVSLIFLCMKLWKLEGLGISFALSYLLYSVLMMVLVFNLTGFRWSPVALKIVVPSLLILTLILCCTQYLSYQSSIIIGMSATVIVAVACLVVLQKLLGIDLIRRLRSKFTAARA
jgi:PST family polysaccharide transporter